MTMMISSMSFLIKKHFIKVLFFIYYNGGSMQIKFNEINRNNDKIGTTDESIKSLKEVHMNSKIIIFLEV